MQLARDKAENEVARVQREMERLQSENDRLARAGVAASVSDSEMDRLRDRLDKVSQSRDSAEMEVKRLLRELEKAQLHLGKKKSQFYCLP